MIRRPPRSTLFPYTNALPILIAYNHFVQQIKVVAVEMDNFSHEFLNIAERHLRTDRKSTRLNSSHRTTSYAVFCLKKKKKNHAYPTNYIRYRLLHKQTDKYVN